MGGVTRLEMSRRDSRKRWGPWLRGSSEQDECSYYDVRTKYATQDRQIARAFLHPTAPVAQKVREVRISDRGWRVRACKYEYSMIRGWDTRAGGVQRGGGGGLAENTWYPLARAWLGGAGCFM